MNFSWPVSYLEGVVPLNRYNNLSLVISLARMFRLIFFLKASQLVFY
jgi:hypothetical protein